MTPERRDQLVRQYFADDRILTALEPFPAAVPMLIALMDRATAAEQELSRIDAVMARTPALDKPTRWENVQHAISTARRADEAERKLAAAERREAEAVAAYDELVRCSQDRLPALASPSTPSPSPTTSCNGCGRSPESCRCEPSTPSPAPSAEERSEADRLHPFGCECGCLTRLAHAALDRVVAELDAPSPGPASAEPK